MERLLEKVNLLKSVKNNMIVALKKCNKDTYGYVYRKFDDCFTLEEVWFGNEKITLEELMDDYKDDLGEDFSFDTKEIFDFNDFIKLTNETDDWLYELGDYIVFNHAKIDVFAEFDSLLYFLENKDINDTCKLGDKCDISHWELYKGNFGIEIIESLNYRVIDCNEESDNFVFIKKDVFREKISSWYDEIIKNLNEHGLLV